MENLGSRALLARGSNLFWRFFGRCDSWGVDQHFVFPIECFENAPTIGSWRKIRIPDNNVKIGFEGTPKFLANFSRRSRQLYAIIHFLGSYEYRLRIRSSKCLWKHCLKVAIFYFLGPYEYRLRFRTGYLKSCSESYEVFDTKSLAKYYLRFRKQNRWRINNLRFCFHTVFVRLKKSISSCLEKLIENCNLLFLGALRISPTKS